MKKILFVRSTPYEEDLNGYNVQGVGVAKAFCRQGYDCDYLNYSKTKDEIIELYECNGKKARVLYKPRYRLFRTGICKEALQESFLSQYDYIICREYNQLMTYLFSKKHNNVSMYSGPYWNMFMIPFISEIYDVIYTKKLNKKLQCKFVKSELAKEFLEKKGYTNLIDVGVGLDTSRFKNVECSDSIKNVIDYMKENRCILYIGTLDANKNIPFLLNVFAEVLKKEPDVKLVLVGKSKQSLKNKLLGKKNESYYRDLILTYPEVVRKSVYHIERIDNPQLQFIYPLAKAFVLPSIHEIFGMVMLEAMYFGTPVVTSRNGGSSTLIRSNEYGCMIEEFDTGKWVQAILRFVNDEEYSSHIRENAQNLVATEYSWDCIVRKMMDCIEQQENR